MKKMHKLIGAAALAAGVVGLGSQVQADNPANAEINPPAGGIPFVTIVRNANTAEDPATSTEVDFEVRYNYYDVNSDILNVDNPNNRDFTNTLTYWCENEAAPYTATRTGTDEAGTDLLYYLCPATRCTKAIATVSIM